MTIETEIHKQHQSSPLVELFTLDCSSIGGLTYRFTNHFAESGSVAFNGLTYTSLPIAATGYELTTSGTQPRPTLTVSNVTSVLLNAVITLGDIVGCKVSRIRTYEKFLDGQPTTDTTQYLGPDVYFIEQKSSHTKTAITWQLASSLDRLGTMLPRRQVLKSEFPGIGMANGIR